MIRTRRVHGAPADAVVTAERASGPWRRQAITKLNKGSVEFKGTPMAPTVAEVHAVELKTWICFACFQKRVTQHLSLRTNKVKR